MPEGHTIHRYARLHTRDLAGRAIDVSSPQGRFSEGAARLDGLRLAGVEALGKHLFYRWSSGDVLHVHLGLFGRFRTHRGEPPPPSDGTRVAFRHDGLAVYLSGPTICRIIDPVQEEELRGRLGPDPLDTPQDGDRFAANLARRRIPIGAALLDQRLLAGIGNVYRSELLFLRGIDPHVPARELIDEAPDLWEEAVRQLRAGTRLGRIVTVDPTEVGAASPARVPRPERLYVYKRGGRPCRRCRTPIVSAEMAGRTVWWCPRCQRS